MVSGWYYSLRSRFRKIRLFLNFLAVFVHFSQNQMLHPRILVDRCDSRIGNRTLRFCIIQGFDDKCDDEMFGIVINAITHECWFCMILEYADRLLTLLMEFYSEMFATRLLVQNNGFKRKMINWNFFNCLPI